MTRPETPAPPEPLRRWLDEELATGAAGVAVAADVDIGEASEAAADEALAALFAVVAPLAPFGPAAPPAGFADRVMARLALEAQAAAPRRSATGRRLTVGLGLAATLATLEMPLWLPLVLRGLQSLVSASSISWVLQAAIDGVLGLAQVTAAVVSWADTLLLLVMAVAKPLAVPPIAAFAALALAISVLSLRSLHALIQRDRRWVYADPI